ncbi:MAG: hypothetical protein IPI59_09795 [Sphingobacteriales bacterium]|jgi:hypothetical protein|nr:hypothetical protein [Sphingobacteriales bacterium]MBK7527826.1 hypothetical protein [Sphingobacteriales bacterium]MBK8678813.1 hypothetical protein [Sphingobacteriales bacterium]MBL0246451.1 hypothetical protein [Sphingobacteriales bacterium]MDA0199298.1 hypothetical protein [Bacteroidota bacterium]
MLNLKHLFLIQRAANQRKTKAACGAIIFAGQQAAKLTKRVELEGVEPSSR